MQRIGLSDIYKLLSDSRFLFLSFFIFCLALGLHYFDYFYLAGSDFHEFRDKAISFVNLELPGTYVRLPFYSMLMGFLSFFLPAKDPFLFAAELINLVCLLASIVLLYLLSSRFLRKSAFVVVWLFALHPVTFVQTTQPRADMLALMLILLGIYLSSLDRRTSYLAAFLASLTRYEGAILIPILALKDLIFSRRKILAILLGFLSSLGIMVWLLLNYKATGHLNPYYMFFGEEHSAAGFEYIILALKVLLFFIPAAGFNFFAVLMLFLIAIGFYSFFKNSLKDALPLFLFFICYLSIHFMFFSPTAEHVFLIIWIGYLAAMGGVERVLSLLTGLYTERKDKLIRA